LEQVPQFSVRTQPSHVPQRGFGLAGLNTLAEAPMGFNTETIFGLANVNTETIFGGLAAAEEGSEFPVESWTSV